MNHLSLDNPTPIVWQHPPARPADGEVHIWTWTHDERLASEESLAWLDTNERERHARLVTAKLQQRFLVAHAGLRRLLASYLDCHPADVPFVASATGKPKLADHTLPFNLSHSGNHAAAAVGNADVGIDTEHLRDVTHLRSLAERHFTASEVAAMDDASTAAATRDFFRIWTRKEAVLKCLGVGLNCPPREFEVGLCPSGVRTITLPTAWKVPSRTCWLVSGQSAGDVALAVAATAPFGSCRVFRPATF